MYFIAKLGPELQNSLTAKQTQPPFLRKVGGVLRVNALSLEFPGKLSQQCCLRPLKLPLMINFNTKHKR